ncbi:hypothetical protein CEXT_414231 [Caerostris extrusa]|uniref:Uncharacterized protein n=1 Tax=Caerostris extrusa TaxID=172846 RepID=A0AAV4U4Z9_CAEEX|nr:hypothetical protein CEXT_414231 [Caerostris extrusa]
MEMNLARTLRQNRVESTGGETPPPSYEEVEAFNIMSKATTLEVYATYGIKTHYFVQEDPRIRTAHQITSVAQGLARYARRANGPGFKTSIWRSICGFCLFLFSSLFHCQEDHRRIECSKQWPICE